MLLLLTALLSLPAASAGSHVDWSFEEADTVRLVEEVEMPTDIDIAADGSIWYAQIEGDVMRYDPTTGETELVHRVENVVTGGERGLVGLALAHDFNETGAFYVYYSERTDDPDGGMNRLVRVVDGEEHILASLTAAVEHNGGRIVVEPNGTLFVGTGENSDHEPAQDLDSLLGKILRMTPEGEPVEGNLKGLVYSYGHRNVYGLTIDPETGTVWAAENMGWRRDEINRIEVGGNYGYPECEGNGLHGIDEPCPTDKGYIFPVKTFYEDRAAAPTGIVFFRGEIYWASFNEGSIHHLWQDPETEEWQDEIVLDHEEWILDLAVGHDGRLYFSAADGIWRVDLPGDPEVTQLPSGNESNENIGGDDPGAQGALSMPSILMVLTLLAAIMVSARRRQ